MEAGELVFKQQHQGKLLYYIHSGSVNILKSEGTPGEFMTKTEIQELKDFKKKYLPEIKYNPNFWEFITEIDKAEGLSYGDPKKHDMETQLNLEINMEISKAPIIYGKLNNANFYPDISETVKTLILNKRLTKSSLEEIEDYRNKIHRIPLLIWRFLLGKEIRILQEVNSKK